MRQPSKEELAFWYGKAKESGFKDIEYGRDLNKTNGQTLRQEGKPGTSNEHYMLWDFQRMDHDGDNALDSMLGWDGATIADHPRRERQRRIAEYAHDPDSAATKKERTIILACIDMHPREAAKMLNMDYTEVTSIWAATLERLELPPEHSHAKRPRVEPEPIAPVRSLSSAEIARLNYTPPKKLK